MKIKKTAVATTTKGKGSVKADTKAKAAPAADSKGSNAGVNTGVKTGIRVMLFQDMTLATNDSLRRPAPLVHIPGQLTDTELAKVWREEFPKSRAVLAGRIDESIVRGVRNLYNNGTGGHGTPGQTHSSKPWVIGENGKRTQAEYTRVRKTEGEEKPKVKATVPASTAAKAAAKVVTAKAAQAVKAVAGKKVVAAKKRAA